MVYLKTPGLLIILFILLWISAPAGCYTGITLESGGGYSSNLYADSLGIGDSYLYGGISAFNVQFDKVKFKSYYDLLYYDYDSRNSINQFNHLAGLSLFRAQPTERLKWSIDIAGTYRDYTDSESSFDNSNIFIEGQISYYILPGLQSKMSYLFKHTDYSEYSILNHSQQTVTGQIIKTFPSRTTIRGKIDYYYRYFKDTKTSVDWLDIEFKLSQSINIRTGVSGTGLIRFAGNGTRPLSSFYILSGVTPYWDPWDGFQVNLFTKRILPWGVIGICEYNYWSRKFSYSETQVNELSWLSGLSSRKDDGWRIQAKFDKQINIFKKLGRSVRLSASVGYLTNNSDDPYYEYDYMQFTLSLKYDIN